ncbi:hypothetical protein [Oceanirhabdus sp. W0125-5]|uniref:hypothetical protein n=1 Tax=Oceanirhabdus sp. W0125-5 TaxID=2999116 RepID=UPI0022F2B6B9|nr:hypothetical protein [Oceanirhabdus sp. W0125-5]WBW96448.1 hypothetical protein OW730_22550 [Oceanirhabdus sp. W0125-5]
MINKLLCAFLPIGLLIQLFNIICKHYNILGSYTGDFLTRMSGVLMIVGIPFCVYMTIKNIKKKKLI